MVTGPPASTRTASARRGAAGAARLRVRQKSGAASAPIIRVFIVLSIAPNLIAPNRAISINGAQTEQFRFWRHRVELRMTDQPPPPDDADPAQIWGRRIGRALGWLAAGALLINLFTHWLF